MTAEGWPVAQLGRMSEILDENRHREDLPKVDETTLGKEEDVTSVCHREAVDLRLDVHRLLRIGLQPRNIDLNIEVTNAVVCISIGASQYYR